MGNELPVSPEAVLRFVPPSSRSSDNAINSFCAFAVTPLATTFVINYPTTVLGYAVAANSAHASITATFPSQSGAISSLRRLIVTARRKPGTTTNAVAQTVTVRKESGAGDILGSFKIAAAAADAEIIAAGFDQSWISGDLAAGAGLHFTITAVDSDLELTAMVFGYST